MKSHYCKAEGTQVEYEGECSWCGEKEMNKTTEALKLAEEALQTALDGMGGSYSIWSEKCKPALAAIRKAKLFQIEQRYEFYTIVRQSFIDGYDAGMVDANKTVADPAVKDSLTAAEPIPSTMKLDAEASQVKTMTQEEYKEFIQSVKQFSNGVTEWYGSDGKVILRTDSSEPVVMDYAAPVDAKAIRAEALEEAAKVGDEHPTWTGRMCAAEIRNMK